jgi:cysteinyl-tRNA synthetase
MLAGARVEVAPYKRDPMDFVLWKPSKPGEPSWESPAGIVAPGRPGWHIECSAMSMKTLLEPYGGGLACEDADKQTFDIHAGGIDLVFPHHENEIAQSCCALGGSRMANVWMHNGFLQVEGEKMSKSIGNFYTMHELLRTDKFGGRSWPGPTLRLAMLRSHYRQPIDWTLRALEEAEKTMQRFARVAAGAPAAVEPSAELLVALADDLNTPEALAHLHVLANEGRGAELRRGLALMGLDVETEIAAQGAEIEPGLKARIEALVAERLAARRAKDFAASDRLRDELAALGVTVKDSKDATNWELLR